MRTVWPVLMSGLLLVGSAGCSGGSTGGSSQPGVTLPQSVAAGPAGDQQRMSINRTSKQDISAKLEANGVDDAERWAQVIAQNQPYPADDPGLGKLRSLLAEQGADQGTVDKIANSFTP